MLKDRFALLVGVLLAICCVVMFVNVASADTMTATLGGLGVTASVTFTGVPSGPGKWLVTGASGPWGGAQGSVTGICPVGDCTSIFTYDNIYYWPEPAMDAVGIVMKFSNGDLGDLCYGIGCHIAGEYTAIIWDPSTGYTYTDLPLAIFTAPTGEPSSLLMLGSGVLGLAGGVRRKLSL